MKEKPKKSLGQHWLFDEVILDSIVKTAGVKTGDNVLEVGPGLGTLTEKLLETGAEIYSVEKDEALAYKLRQTLKQDNFKLFINDILQFDLTSLPAGYKVVANIPYYLTSHLIRNLTESKNSPQSITLLVQKEVAERICAKPGHMSLLSVSAQLYYSCSLSVEVTKDKFTPPPKVDSQVVHLIRKKPEEIPDISTKDFFRVVKAGFSSRRKTLLNSLSGGLDVDKQAVKENLEKLGISPSQRPQELSLSDWHRLSEKF
ncbi:MAG TPA: 16S rRNA (adenine(1518)-N(6)/adenine(1519)-N(6))-dimethyltransferase RsmA [Candidatus Saccharimonadales bacterium]|nr:16S rRNA (adenine(1518)-N(6)/adenine(1519)-N(6))-dimethyltransferase RsmA [Candidatus Saccharimonadales bacterium]